MTKTVKENYESVIQKIKASLKLHANRNLNLFQKVWILNSFILSKIWYLAQVFAPNLNHIALIYSSCTMFIWNNQFFKVARNQLFLDVEKGGVGLIDIALKTKALFIKNILFAKTDNDVTTDQFMLEQFQNTSLTKNTRDWLCDASRLSNETHLTSTKLIYSFLQNEKPFVPKIMEENPDLDWHLIWENVNKNFLSSYSRETLFLALNDVICTKSKQYRNNVVGVSSDTCDFCNYIDTVEHRIKHCTSTAPVWAWLTSICNKIGVYVEDPEEILVVNIGDKDYQRKAILFLVSEVIRYNVKKHDNACLDDFKNVLRDYRWNNRILVAKHFSKYVNVC